MVKIIHWGQKSLNDFQLPCSVPLLKKLSPFNGHTFHVTCGRAPNESFHEHIFDPREEYTYCKKEIDESITQVSAACSQANGDGLSTENGNGVVKDWWNYSKDWANVHGKNDPPLAKNDSEKAWERVFERIRQAAYIAGKSGCRGLLCDFETFEDHFGQASEDTLNLWNGLTVPDRIDLVRSMGCRFGDAIVHGFDQGRKDGRMERRNYPDDVEQNQKIVVYLNEAFYSIDAYHGKENHVPTVSDPRWLNHKTILFSWFLNGVVYNQITYKDRGLGSGRLQFIDACEPESYNVHVMILIQQSMSLCCTFVAL